jgi:hypothetical protein
MTDDLLINLHYFSIIFATLVPLYYWYIRRERDSVVVKVCRGIRVLNALFYAVAFLFVLELFWNELELGMPLLIAMPVISYVLARRWAPSQIQITK